YFGRPERRRFCENRAWRLSGSKVPQDRAFLGNQRRGLSRGGERQVVNIAFGVKGRRLFLGRFVPHSDCAGVVSISRNSRAPVASQCQANGNQFWVIARDRSQF